MSEETLDFTGATIDSFKVVGREEPVEKVVEPEPAPQPEAQQEPEAPKPESSGDDKAPEPAKIDPVEYKFKDDFIKGVVEFYEKTGDLTAYLQAKTVDFNKMSDEEILRRELREQYSELSDGAFERLYKQQVVDKYKLDPDEWSEDDAQLERELMKVEASKLRSKYVEWQNGFKAPEPEPTDADKQMAEQMARFEQEVKTNPLTKGLVENKKISLKTQDGEFNYEVEPNALLDMTLDNDRFFAQFANDKGELDYDRWYKVAAYSNNPEQFERSLINFGKTLGRQEIAKEIKNPTVNTAGDVPTEGASDFRSGLLQAFAARGIHK
jgi:hypothetical protein